MYIVTEQRNKWDSEHHRSANVELTETRSWKIFRSEGSLKLRLAKIFPSRTRLARENFGKPDSFCSHSKKIFFELDSLGVRVSRLASRLN